MPQPIQDDDPKEPEASVGRAAAPAEAQATQENTNDASRKRKLDTDDATRNIEQSPAPAAPVPIPTGPILVDRIAPVPTGPILVDRIIEKPPETFEPTAVQAESLAARLSSLSWRQIDELLGTETADKVQEMVKNKTIRETRADLIRQVEEKIKKSDKARDKFMTFYKPKKKKARVEPHGTNNLDDGRAQSTAERNARLIAAISAAPRPSVPVMLGPVTNFVANARGVMVPRPQFQKAPAQVHKPGVSPPRGAMSGRGLPGRGRGHPGRGLPLARGHSGRILPAGRAPVAPPFRYPLPPPNPTRPLHPYVVNLPPGPITAGVSPPASTPDPGDEKKKKKEMAVKKKEGKAASVSDSQVVEKPKDVPKFKKLGTGTGIYGDTPEPAWLQHRLAFDLFRSRTNGMNPMVTSTNQNERLLASWVLEQERLRVKVLNGNADALAKVKIESLKTIQPPFPFFSKNVRQRLEELRAYKEQHGHANVAEKDDEVLSRWVRSVRHKNKTGVLDEDLKEVLESIGVSWDLAENNWNAMYDELKRFREIHGHCKIAYQRNGEWTSLQRWATSQRLSHSDGRLSDDHRAKLDALGFVFEMPPRKTIDDYFEQLKAFKEQHGHVDVREGDELKLSKYVSHVRSRFKSGTLDSHSILKLKEIELGFSTPIDRRIQALLEDLRDFKREYGHLDPERKHARLLYFLEGCKTKRTAGTLNNLVELELEDIGVEWAQFDTMLEEVKSYYEQFGHINIGRGRKDEEYKDLNCWIFNQKLNYHDGLLSPDKITKLEELQIDWEMKPRNLDNKEDDRSYTDEERLEQVRAFKEEHGHCNITKTKDGSLGLWVQDVRAKYKQGTLDEQLRIRCEEAGLAWSQWGEMYNQLLAYKELHGHAKPPSREYIPGYKYTVLGRWCSTMRHNHSNGKLSEERIKLLEDIGFEWAEIKTTPWEERLQELVRYKEEFGNTNVPKLWEPNKPLARWVHSQRSAYSRNQLSQERYDALDELGFIFSFKSNKADS